jgi:carboxylesterase type B
MHGTNADEGESFCPLNQNATLNDLLTFWKASDFNDAQIAKLTDLYIVNQTYPGVDRDTTFFYYAGERSYGDYSMSCSSVYSSGELAKQFSMGTRSSPVYLYSFDYIRSHKDFSPHFSEVTFVFHWEYLGFNDADKATSDVMTSYWGNFIMSHDPSSRIAGTASINDWPRFDSQSLSALTIASGTDQHATARFKGEQCDFFNAILDQRIRNMF